MGKRLIQLRSKLHDQLGNRQVPGERDRLPRPLGPISRFTSGFRGRVQNLGGVVCNGICRDRVAGHLITNCRKFIGDTSRGPAGNGFRHHGRYSLVVQGGPVAVIGGRLGTSDKRRPQLGGGGSQHGLAAIPAPSMMPPAAITGIGRLRTRTRDKAIIPRQSSRAAGSKTPRWPPASNPCATTASIPAAAAARPS